MAALTRVAALSPEEAIRAALSQRRTGATICPTDAARRLAGATWREALPAVHEAARRMAAAGEVRLQQRGAAVCDPRGAYRIGRA